MYKFLLQILVIEPELRHLTFFKNINFFTPFNFTSVVKISVSSCNSSKTFESKNVLRLERDYNKTEIWCVFQASSKISCFLVESQCILLHLVSSVMVINKWFFYKRLNIFHVIEAIIKTYALDAFRKKWHTANMKGEVWVKTFHLSK